MKDKKLTEKLPEQCGGCPDLKENWEDYDPCNCEEFCEVVFERGEKAGRKAGIAEYKADIPIKFQPWPKAYTAGRKAEAARILEMLGKRKKAVELIISKEPPRFASWKEEAQWLMYRARLSENKEIEKLIRGDDK